MAFIAPKPTNNYEQKPTGKFSARLVWLIDLGTQLSTWEGQEKEQRKVLFAFETPENGKEFDPNKGWQPYLYTRQFTLSMGNKSSLREFIENCIMEGLTDEEAYDFDFESLVNRPLELKAIAKKSKDGSKTYTVLHSVEITEKEVKEAINPINIFYFPDLEGKTSYTKKDFNQKTFEALPNWIQEEIKKSKEYKKMFFPSIEKMMGQTVEDEELPSEDVTEEAIETALENQKGIMPF